MCVAPVARAGTAAAMRSWVAGPGWALSGSVGATADGAACPVTETAWGGSAADGAAGPVTETTRGGVPIPLLAAGGAGRCGTGTCVDSTGTPSATGGGPVNGGAATATSPVWRGRPAATGPAGTSEIGGAAAGTPSGSTTQAHTSGAGAGSWRPPSGCGSPWSSSKGAAERCGGAGGLVCSAATCRRAGGPEVETTTAATDSAEPVRDCGPSVLRGAGRCRACSGAMGPARR